MVDRLTVAIAGKRERVAKLRDEISRLTNELQTEELKLKTLEEVAGEVPEATESEIVESHRETRIQPLFDYPRTGRYRSPRRLPRGRDKMHGDIATMPLTALALRALSERFPEGTTTQQLNEFLGTEWNRPQKLNSLQATLSQLKTQGEIDFRNQLWVFIDKEVKE